MSQFTMNEIVSLAKMRGIVFPGSEIYDGLANSWDYGPIGVEMKNNVKRAWWKKFVQQSPYNVGLDAAILMNPKTWVASGHVGGFNDPLMDCKHCKSRFRADKLIEDYFKAHGEEVVVDGWSNEKMEAFIKEKEIPCPECGKSDFTEIRQFNLMFKTFQGVTEDSTSQLYLRPETAQGIFVNFKNVQRTTRKRVPFGIGQIGKSFRNEITPGNFIFRTREFEQMELEFFCEPGTELDWYNFWRKYCFDWLVNDLGVNKEKLRLREHAKEELSHYSNGTTDIEYEFPFGWGELWGIASRTNYDLTQHQNESKVKQEYIDPVQNKRYIPYVVEPSLGVERLLLVLLCDAYEVEKLENDERTVLHFDPKIAPVKVAVLPLVKKGQVKAKAEELYQKLLNRWNVEYDETQSIGKRYRRQDELGTPFCVTVDFDTVGEGESDPAKLGFVTVRERDSMKQELVKIDELEAYLSAKLGC